MKLRYVNEGDPKLTKQWLPGIPADHHEQPDYDVARCLIASGLYEYDPDLDLPKPEAPASDAEPVDVAAMRAAPAPYPAVAQIAPAIPNDTGNDAQPVDIDARRAGPAPYDPLGCTSVEPEVLGEPLPELGETAPESVESAATSTEPETPLDAHPGVSEEPA